MKYTEYKYREIDRPKQRQGSAKKDNDYPENKITCS